ncbi:DUF2516 family protein [Streptomyces antimicrobicus]|uniref:DUF2516 family protein n=1 Tax=Streptomyces antimicrobicus TaxID=2883108 RepID=A0ABS8B2S2_9ACTN|nr:DUF2516 family protein [Streptomyces antimicrobicus]MCB5178897.1 DUF2516 family protein [Streptomyces antimicrobicus]
MLMDQFDSIWVLIDIGMLVFAAVACLLALAARSDAYRAADKQTKTFWTVVLGFTVLFDFLVFWGLLGGLMFLQIAGLIATIVFMVDVRPALAEVSGGGRRRGGSSSDGPYGPYNGGR